MKNKHRWYEVIVTWASGEKIQVREKCNEDDEFTTFEGLNPCLDAATWEWRIKPKVCIKRYRMALVNNFPNKEVIAVDISGSCIDDPIEYGIKGFIRWVGDIVEVEVERD